MVINSNEAHQNVAYPIRIRDQSGTDVTVDACISSMTEVQHRTEEIPESKQYTQEENEVERLYEGKLPFWRRFHYAYDNS